MKGISALIASVLLVAFVVSVGLLVMGWFTTLTRSTTVSVSNKTDEGVSCSSAAVSVEDVYITAGNNTTGSSRAIIKNTGYTDNLIITSAELYNTTGHNHTASSLPIGDFDKGEIVTLSFPSSSVTTCPTVFSRVVVTTNCGGISDTFSGTPKCS